jgi:hypothetical protein
MFLGEKYVQRTTTHYMCNVIPMASFFVIVSCGDRFFHFMYGKCLVKMSCTHTTHNVLRNTRMRMIVQVLQTFWAKKVC